MEFGDALVADLGVVGAGEHLGDEVAALAAEVAAEILVEVVETAGGFLFGKVGFDPFGGGAGIDAFGAALGGGIVDGDGERVPVAFAVIKDHVGRIAGLADGQAGNFADFLAVDEEQAVPGVASDGGVEDGVVEHAIGTNSGRRLGRGVVFGLAGQGSASPGIIFRLGIGLLGDIHESD